MSDTGVPPDIPDVAALVEVFNRHQVNYVIIGAAAAQFYLAGLVTHDVDFTPATDADNLAPTVDRAHRARRTYPYPRRARGSRLRP